MKIGDLIEWHSKCGEDDDLGIIVEIYPSFFRIAWARKPEMNGMFPKKHACLRFFDESR